MDLEGDLSENELVDIETCDEKNNFEIESIGHLLKDFTEHPYWIGKETNLQPKIEEINLEDEGESQDLDNFIEEIYIDDAQSDIINDEKSKNISYDVTKRAKNGGLKISQLTKQDIPPNFNTKKGTKSQNYRCHICHKEFAAEKNLFLHHLNSHAADRSYTCKICDKNFSYPIAYANHIKYSHKLREKDSQFNCDQCGKFFRKKVNLKRHVSIHNNRYQFQCEICEKRFSLKKNLARHLLIHADGDEVRDLHYKCLLCDKTYTENYHVRRHMMAAHFNLKPYQCNICKKCFANTFELTRHVPIHSDCKTYECSLCNKAFKSPQSLTRHKHRHDARVVKYGTSDLSINYKKLI